MLVGPATYAATRDVFDYQPLDPVALKGKAEPVPVFRALAPRARLGTDVTRSLATPMVGRQIDLGILTGAFQKAVQESAVQLVMVAGEPGVGKSRLVAELLLVRRCLAGAGPLAPGPVPALRGGDHVLGAGGDRQGRGGHPGVRPAGDRRAPRSTP